MKRDPRHTIGRDRYDTSRPFYVLDNGRSWNRGMGRHSTLAQAKRRARDLNRPENRA
jgi:hypothetical protein